MIEKNILSIKKIYLKYVFILLLTILVSISIKMEISDECQIKNLLNCNVRMQFIFEPAVINKIISLISEIG